MGGLDEGLPLHACRSALEEHCITISFVAADRGQWCGLTYADTALAGSEIAAADISESAWQACLQRSKAERRSDMPLVLQVAVNDVGWDMQTLRTLNLTLQQHTDDRPALRQKEVRCARGPPPPVSMAFHHSMFGMSFKQSHRFDIVWEHPASC